MEQQVFRARLIEKLADSLHGPVTGGTRRRLFRRPSLTGKATAVIGMRRAGKTTYLHQLRQDWLSQGWGRARIPYLNFEDERLAGVPASMLHVLIDEFYRRHPELRLRESVAWCFDEIQVVSGWERFVRRILDEENVVVYLSGSSAALLSREIATAMRGRAWEIVLYPFSFLEFLDHHQQAVPEDPTFLSAVQRSALERQFLDYLEVGGFPEAQGLDLGTRARLLTDYVDVATFRDVAERHAVSNLAGLRWLVRHLLGNAGGSFSVEKFHRSLKSQGFSISRDTVHQLLSYLEDCFLVRTVWVEATSDRQRMVHPRKAYPIDTGLIPVFDRSGKANLGHALETAVLLELERRGKSLT